MKSCLRCGKEFSEGDFCSECGGRLNEQVTTNCAAEEHTVKVYFKKGEGSPFDDDLCRNGTLFSVNVESEDEDCMLRFLQEVDSESEADYVVTKDNYEEFIEEYCYGHRDLTAAERKKLYDTISNSDLLRYGAVINVSVFDTVRKCMCDDWSVVICSLDDPAGDNVDCDMVPWYAGSTDDFLRIFIAEGSDMDGVAQILDVLEFVFNVFDSDNDENVDDEDDDWDDDDWDDDDEVEDDSDGDDGDDDEMDDDSDFDSDEDDDDTESNEVVSPEPTEPEAQPTSSVNTQPSGMDRLNSQLNDLQSKLDQQMREMQEKLDQMLKNK